MIRNATLIIKIIDWGKTINDSGMAQYKNTDNELQQIYFRL